MKNPILFAIAILTSSYSMGQSERNLTNNSGQDRYASYSPSGDKILFESNRDGNWNIYLMDPDGSNQQKLTSDPSDNRRPSWHPSGSKILFESTRSGQNYLYELNLQTKRISQIVIKDLEGEPGFSRYSPSGKKIAFTIRKSEDESNIATVSSNGKNLKYLTTTPFRTFYPFWSPDGSLLSFSSRHETNNEDDEIYIIKSDGSEEKRLTNWPKHNFCAAWSPDGKKIAYATSMEEIRPEIYIMDADGGNQTRITNNLDGDTLPHWLTDGEKLIITGYRNGNFEICEIILNGSVSNKKPSD